MLSLLLFIFMLLYFFTELCRIWRNETGFLLFEAAGRFILKKRMSNFRGEGLVVAFKGGRTRGRVHVLYLLRAIQLIRRGMEEWALHCFVVLVVLVMLMMKLN
ncbi:hypothetical protein K440DRAFT_98390 [Wilcoxina mikolae CBS 423.85]|nr:hypothetical protein K440DRAFT_98390 [Wilcoxina mikolae CBS 423.85]